MMCGAERLAGVDLDFRRAAPDARAIMAAVNGETAGLHGRQRCLRDGDPVLVGHVADGGGGRQRGAEVGQCRGQQLEAEGCREVGFHHEAVRLGFEQRHGERRRLDDFAEQPRERPRGIEGGEGDVQLELGHGGRAPWTATVGWVGAA